MENEQKALIKKIAALDREDSERRGTVRLNNYHRSSSLIDEYKNRFIRPFLKSATRQDYKDWLEGWLGRGGEVNHEYDYEFPSRFYVAVANFQMIPLHGSSAIQVIVPEDVDIDLTRGVGHSNFYFMKNFDVYDSFGVSSYSNIHLGHKCNCNHEVKVTVEVDGQKEAWSFKNLFGGRK